MPKRTYTLTKACVNHNPQNCAGSTMGDSIWECCYLAAFYNNVTAWQDTTLQYEHFGER